MTQKIRKLVLLIAILCIALPVTAFAKGDYAPLQQTDTVSFTILHTNDFHGNLEPNVTSSYPGMARTAKVINDVRALVGAENVLLLDAGDIMQGTLLSNLQKGLPTIATYNAMDYAAATFGNHEFDWGQTVLGDRVTQADFPFVAANIVSGACTADNWTPPSFVEPYVTQTVGAAGNQVTVGIIGVGSVETPFITVASATAGLCFKDPAESILHYYNELDAISDVIVVLSHNGLNDGGYGYGFTVYGDTTLAQKLIDAGKPVPLIIGGHSHTNLSAASMVGSTAVVQAHSAGRKVGRADLVFDRLTGAVTVTWQRLTIDMAGAQDTAINDLIMTYVNDATYQTLINQEIGWTNVPLVRDYNGDSVMGAFINDAVYNEANTDGTTDNDVDMVFNNPGGLRVDICDPLVSPCTFPHKLTYGEMFSVLPFGNATAIGDMTGAQIVDLLNQSATLFKGALQVAGVSYKFYSYTDALPGPQPYAWGAYDIMVLDRDTDTWEPLEVDKTYRVATNEFLAPAGQDGFVPFKYMTNITYWGDMLNMVNAWVQENYPETDPYDFTLDGRITRDGDATGGSIVPITFLHHNDSHGRLVKTVSGTSTFQGYTQLATIINQERAHNPDRTLLLSSGDNIQGDSMMYFFKSAGLGYTADGTVLDPSLTTHPMMAVMNAMDYDAWTLGNHEFNFGKDIFTSVIGQANFPTLQANLEDDGQYGLATANVLPYIEKEVGPEGIKVAILGIGNHRVPNYELPSNIPGLTFTDPILTAQELSDELRPTNDVVLALTHIGFTTNPASVEVDNNVDTYLAEVVTGLDAIIGGHSHTNPSVGQAPYKYLPAFVAGPDNTPVIINQAYRYNNTLGEVVLGMREVSPGEWEVVSRAGRYVSISTSTVEDPAIKAIVDPYTALLDAYNNTVVGQTTQPIDTNLAFTQETNGANLQADAAVWELESHGIEVDFHLSGAMTNKLIATTATPETPYTLLVSDMFSAMPYENSLVVLSMNGPQLKEVLERAYRNYYYYKYVPGWGGYSYYTTCMIDINAIGKITYNDLNPELPNGNNVVSLVVGGEEIDFTDADTFYEVSTVNYLAAGSCNFNNDGVSLWPLDQLSHDTQYYVRDSVINYVHAMGIVSPVIEGRLNFITDLDAPVININAPMEITYAHTDALTIDFTVTDEPAGVESVAAFLDGVEVVNGQEIDLFLLSLGEHTFTVEAMDKAGNFGSKSVTFTVGATASSMILSVQRLYEEGYIDDGILAGMIKQLQNAEAARYPHVRINKLFAFIDNVVDMTGKHIDQYAADILITEAMWVIEYTR